MRLNSWTDTEGLPGRQAAYCKHTAQALTTDLHTLLHTHTLHALRGLGQWANLTWPEHWP